MIFSEVMIAFLGVILGAFTGAVMFYILERVHGMGYVSKKDFYEIADAVDMLDNRVHKTMQRANLENSRAKRKEQGEMIEKMLPSIVQKLPIDEKLKEAIGQIPPEGLSRILKMIQKSGIE